MRLIDADALIKEIHDILTPYEEEAVKRALQYAPTIDTSGGCKGCKHWIYRSNFGEDCEFENLENCKYEPKDGR